MKRLMAIIALTSLSACAGPLDMGSLLGTLPAHLDCTLACAACIAALHADGAEEAPPAAHVACAAHCTGCASGMVADIAEVAESAEVEPAPLVDGPVCVERIE